MGKKPASRDEQIYIFADKALKDLGFIAPEDTDMRRTKIYNQMTMLDAPLSRIHKLMSGVEWSPDTLDEIAEVLRDAGFEVKDHQ